MKSKGTIIYSVGDADYYLRFPNGKVERVRGTLRFLWLGVWLTLRGYKMREQL